MAWAKNNREKQNQYWALYKEFFNASKRERWRTDKEYRERHYERERRYRENSFTSRKRFKVLLRDDFTCQYCGRKSPKVILHVDHIIPKSKGGTNLMENLRTACSDCNLGRGNIDLDSSLHL